MFSIKSFKETHKKKVSPGTYIARVTSVTEDIDTVGSGAFIVYYELINSEDSEVQDFKEKFFNTTANKRTSELKEIMDQLGIDDLDDLVGIVFDVDIKTRVTRSGSSFPSIVSRKVHLPDDAPTEDTN